MTKLAIARGLDLPLDAVTQKLAFMGKTGSGKTYGASKLVEQMLDAGAQVVVLDPVGAWHGLRLPGTGPGYEIPVLGGLHGDIPLEHTSGAVVAELVASRHISVVLDVSQMTGTEQARFATDFATRFFDLKKASASAVHLVVEECQEFIPQNAQPGEQRMLHAFERLVKLGRNFGIGVSLISQRPQEVNKKGLNQTECLFAFQMTGPQERKAMAAWMSDKGVETGLVDALPSLQPGHCFVWSPSWLDVSKQVHILPKRSVDASSTPKVGAAARPTQTLTPIDLGQLLGEMAETIERTKADDPAALRKRIAELEKQVAAAPTKRVEVLVPNMVFLDHVSAARLAFEEMGVTARSARAKLDDITAAIERVSGKPYKGPPLLHEPGRLPIDDRDVKPENVVHRDIKPEKPVEMHGLKLKPEAEWPKLPPPRELAPSAGDGKLKRGARNMLDVLVRHHPTRLSRGVLAARAGMSESGTFGDYLGALRQQGLIETDAHGLLGPSTAGLKRSGVKPGTPMARAEILAVWAKATKAGARRMLSIVLNRPDGVSRDELAQLADMSNSGTFGDYLGFLRKHLLVAEGSPIKPGPALEGTR